MILDCASGSCDESESQIRHFKNGLDKKQIAFMPKIFVLTAKYSIGIKSNSKLDRLKLLCDYMLTKPLSIETLNKALKKVNYNKKQETNE